MKHIVDFIRHLFKKSESEKLRDKILNEDIDFNNVVSSSLLANQLYDELKKIAHPDRYQDPELIIKATELFQSIHQNKRDYSKLLILRERVYAELITDNTSAN